MDLLKLYQDEDSTADTSSDHLSSDSLGSNYTLDEQPIPPRIGDEFQVVLPPLERRSPHEDDSLVEINFPFKLGLDIPVTWALETDEHDLEASVSANGMKAETTKTRVNCESYNKKQNRGERFRSIPAVSTMTWSDEEKKIFLLGLYIFGKNLVQVKRFMECKKMGEILSFYYGDFYRSDAHRRWSECRKIRSRRHIYGRRIFSGWRHNELLQRLDQNLSDASRCALFEAMKALSECKLSLEEYVFSLKAAVGFEALVQAIGIGVENYDLTGLASDPAKTAHLVSSRVEIPVGKACSSLTSGDIIKFLTGDFRLSKAKSNDLFWEAVWPRLLAKGWHSEQPKDSTFAASRHPLVFLMPTVKKFSRKLVKGRHYFDSIADVLNKVAADPRLLELEMDGEGRVDRERDGEINMEENGSTSGQHNHHLYLLPHLPSFNSELMKFTVVDTSLVNVRDLRSLPVDPVIVDYGPSPYEALTDSSEDDDEKPAKGPPVNRDGKPRSTKGRALNSREVDSVKDEEFQLHARAKSRKPNYLSPVSKRQRLTACKDPESVLLALSSEDPVHKSLTEVNESIPTSECMPCGIENKNDITEPRTLIDLNLPQFPPDFDSCETVNSEVADSREDLNTSNHHHQPREHSNGVLSQSNPSVNARRQSTRNRPLTTRALEALASGFLAAGRKGSSKPTIKTKSSSRAVSRLSRSSLKIAENVDQGSTTLELTNPEVEAMDEEYSSINPNRNPNLP